MTIDPSEEFANAPSLGEQMSTGEVAAFWPNIFHALWAGTIVTLRWARAAPGRIRRAIRRTHIRLVVQMIPEDVTDSGELYERTFVVPPQNADHEHYRRTISILSVIERTAEQDAQFVQYLRGLKAYGEDPIRIWIDQARRRGRAPSTTPAPQNVVAAQALLGAPVPGLSMFSQYMAAALVVISGYALWMRADAVKFHARVDIERQHALDAETRNAGLTDRVKMAEASLATSHAAMNDYQARITAMQQHDAVLTAEHAAIRRREREKTNAIRNGGAVDDAGLLRELAEPAAVSDPPVPAGGGATAAAGLQPILLHAAGADASAATDSKR